MIETERLHVIACTKMHFDLLLQNERSLAGVLGAELAENWLHFPEATPHALKMLEANPQAIRWGMHVILHKADNKLIGTAGFKGVPDENGMVEIGYGIAPGYQNRGLATEAARGMIEYAFSWSQVRSVEAHTLAGENASGRVLQKCGLTKIAEKIDPEDGPVWQWRIRRDEFEKTPR